MRLCHVADHIHADVSDTRTVTAAKEILSGRSKKSVVARLLPFLGPAFIASVAYIDPGNYATNIQGGAQFGYTLLWVIVASNLMAMLLQTLSAKLGIATGKNLAEQCRAHFPHPVVWAMWVLMELVAMATDLAEFLGAALGFNLLFGIPLWLAGFLTAASTFHQQGLQDVGTIEEAYRTLQPLLGSAASWIFAISLLASGLSSSSVGTMAGQVIMQGLGIP